MREHASRAGARSTPLVSPTPRHGRAGPELATAPWVIPGGYAQSIVSDETDLGIYVTNDWHDMNTANQTRKNAGRYLYRTHEVRGGAVGNDGNSLRIDGGSGGSVSVVDLKCGVGTEVVGRSDWEALDSLVWTPWHTLFVNVQHSGTGNHKTMAITRKRK